MKASSSCISFFVCSSVLVKANLAYLKSSVFVECECYVVGLIWDEVTSFIAPQHGP